MLQLNVQKIAEELKLSRMTVYRVLNSPLDVAESTRKRVTEALNRHGGYTFSPQTRRTVVFDFSNPFSCGYMSVWAEALKARFPVERFRFFEGNCRADRRGFIKKIETADTAIFFASLDREIMDSVKEANPELTVISLFGDSIGDIVIRPDDWQGGRLAAQRMIACGFRRVLVLLPEMYSDEESSFLDRCKSFQSEFLWNAPERKIDFLSLPRHFCESESSRLIQQALRKKIEAIFVPNGFMAKRLYSMLSNQENPPYLLGYDSDSDASQTYPFDRIVFHEMELVRWTEFFLGTHVVIDRKDPVRILIPSQLQLK